MDQTEEWKRRIQEARLPIEARVLLEVTRALKQVERSSPEEADSILRVVLESLDPVYLFQKPDATLLAHTALEILARLIQARKPDDPRRRALVHFLLELFAENVRKGGTSDIVADLESRLPKLIQAGDRDALRYVAVEHVAPFGDPEGDWPLMSWTGLLTTVFQDLKGAESDEFLVWLVSAKMHHTRFHHLLRQRRVEEAFEVAQTHLDDSVWEEADTELTLEVFEELRYHQELDRLKKLRSGETS